MNIANTRRMSGFTLMELLVCSGIVVLVAGGVFIAMSQGAANVHRGSFNAQASNQAAWIVTLLRRDIAKSDLSRINFVPDDGQTWRGSTDFVITTDMGEATYTVESRGAGRAFTRAEAGGRKMFFAGEFLSEISVELDRGAFEIKMLMKDPAGRAQDLKWNSKIYVPVPAGMDQYWKPLSSIN